MLDRLHVWLSRPLNGVARLYFCACCFFFMSVWLYLLMFGVFGMSVEAPLSDTLDPPSWIEWVYRVSVITPLHAFSEELVFRCLPFFIVFCVVGYEADQQLWPVLRRGCLPVLIVLVSLYGLWFGSAHGLALWNFLFHGGLGVIFWIVFLKSGAYHGFLVHGLIASTLIHISWNVVMELQIWYLFSVGG